MNPEKRGASEDGRRGTEAHAEQEAHIMVACIMVACIMVACIMVTCIMVACIMVACIMVVSMGFEKWQTTRAFDIDILPRLRRKSPRRKQG